MKKIVLIDLFGFLFRSYYALPPLYNSDNFPTSLLSGFATFVSSVYDTFRDSFIVFAIEGGGDSVRKSFYPDYKSNRHHLPEDLTRQITVAVEWLDKMHLPTASVVGFEADDCIASLAHRALDHGYGDILIVSQDKDFYQLIGDRISIYDYQKKQILREDQCLSRFGIHPRDFIMYQSIVGDSTDNVPGIRGIGAKGALNIIRHFRSLEALYGIDHAPSFSAPEGFGPYESALVPDVPSSHLDLLLDTFGKRTTSLIIDGRYDAFISRYLVTLRTDLLRDFSMDLRPPVKHPLFGIMEDLREYGMNRLLVKLQAPLNTDTFSYVPHLIVDEDDLFSILDSIADDVCIAFDCESTGLDVRRDKMVGFSFSFDGLNGYYVPFLHTNLHDAQISVESSRRALEFIFRHDIIGHNLKFDISMVKNNFGITPSGRIFDSMILAWLMRNDSTSLSLDNLMKTYFNHTMISFKDVVGTKYSNFGDVDLREASVYASEDAVAAFKLYQLLASEIDDSLLDVANSVEFDFIRVLVSMEDSGFKIDAEHFSNLKEKFAKDLSELRKIIVKIVGVDFNLNSPKQLGEILFDRLGLTSNKKNSTDDRVLRTLSHPVIPHILRYREIFKMSSTYIDPLLELKDSNDRIYTTFMQTGTSTGRLSSKSPNLQNIPVRTQMGRSIREGFIADDGHTLIGVDYSQIELRLLAHFSKDDMLVSAFMNGLDIHVESARRIFKHELECLEGSEDVHFVESEKKRLRNIAKSINFGLIYGMGSKKLAQMLGISQSSAKEYIDSYFNNFPTVRSFLKHKEEEIARNGYYETLLGRRRYINFSNVSDFMKTNYLREGINGIFQGSAADIIKLSMQRIFSDVPEAKMLVQIHDELVFEVQSHRAEELGGRILDIMNNIFVLEVPLACNVSYGKNWASLK